MPTLAVAQQLRTDLAVLTDDAAAAVRRLLSKVTDADQAREVLVNELPVLVETYGPAAATVAADWYDELRDQERIDRRFRAIVADLPADLGTEELVGWGLSPVYSASPDWPSATSLIVGGLQRRILAPARETVTGSSVADPSARGWQRVGTGECPFCAMLIARGAVYTKATVDFGAHDHCRCQGVPAWGGRPIPVQPHTPTNRNITDADRARVHAWIATNL